MIGGGPKRSLSIRLLRSRFDAEGVKIFLHQRTIYFGVDGQCNAPSILEQIH